MIAPEVKQRVIGELAEKNAGRLKEGLLHALDEGWLLFNRGKPQQRLSAYLANTLESDIPLVTDPSYLEKLSHGQAPMLLAVQMMQSPTLQAAMVQGTAKPPPTFWPTIISTLPGYVFMALSRDFRDLEREAVKELAAS